MCAMLCTCIITMGYDDVYVTCVQATHTYRRATTTTPFCLLHAYIYTYVFVDALRVAY
jgi:hypothetical protein